MRRMRATFDLFAQVLALCLALSGPARAEPDPLALMAERDAICANAGDAPACSLAKGRVVALVANAIAEAGQTRDRGAFIDLVRGYLGAKEPELRASAAYALAKLAPDATDTPLLVGLLRDKVSAVRDGAWAAAAASTDPAARRIIDRFPDRVDQNGYGPDPAPYDTETLGVTLPEGVEYLWLSSPRRIWGEFQFLASGPPAALVDNMTGLAGQGAMTPEAVLTRWPAAPGRIWGFQDQSLFGPVTVVPFLTDATAEPSHYAVIYEDRLFAAAGLTLIQADGRDLVPVPSSALDPVEEPLVPLDDPTAFDAALMAQSGARPEAPAEETALYLMIAASGGAAAEVYQELYPDGAYAAEVRALIAAPRLILDAVRYPETGPVLADLVNLPAGSTADLTVVGPEGEVAFARAEATGAGPIVIDISGRVSLGSYRVRATVSLPDSAAQLTLWRDFSVELAQAELRIAKPDFAPGEKIEIDFQGMSGSDQDYIATVEAGAPLTSFLTYAYTGGAREGRLTLTAPTAPGHYELRAFFREDESVLRGSVAFVVQGIATEASPAPEVTTDIPDDSARASLELDRTSFAPGEAILVRYDGMSGSTSDYVSIAAAGAPNSSYLQYAYTDGGVEGMATLTAPSAPGTYEVRAFFREDETILRGRVIFTVK